MGLLGEGALLLQDLLGELGEFELLRGEGVLAVVQVLLGLGELVPQLGQGVLLGRDLGLELLHEGLAAF